MTVYWLVWDAAAHWVVDRLDREGALPAVRELRERGVSGAGRPPAPNCQTPPSLATLFTGEWPDRHGVTGYDVPAGDLPPGGDPAGLPVEAQRSGFAPGMLRTPPVWDAAAAGGARSVFVHAPWALDAGGAAGPHVDAVIDAYGRRLARHDALPLAPGARATWSIGPHEVAVAGVAGGARLSVGGPAAGGAVIDVAVGADWVPVRLAPDTGCWVRCLATEAGPTLLRTGTWTTRVTGADAALVARLAAAPLFTGEGIGSLYRTGRLGRTLLDGGDGRAEEAFLSSLDRVVRSFGGAVDAVLAGHAADLVVVYLPVTDDVAHDLVGWCDARSTAHRPDVAGALWGYVSRCYGWADALLGRILRHASPDDTVLLGADHGVLGSPRVVRVNEHLVRAGLAAVTPDGRLDPARSDVLYHPANNGSLWVNEAGRPGGRVPAERVAATLRRAVDAVRTIVDPADGARVVTGFLDPAGRPLPDDPAGPSAYLVFAGDYQPSAAVDGGPVIRDTRKSGSHVVNSGDDRLHATVAAAGPGIPAGRALGVVDNTLGARLARHALGAGGRPEELAGLGPAVPGGRR